MNRYRWVVVFVILFVSPAFPTEVQFFVLTPPEQVLQGVKHIAILDFAVSASYDYSNTSTEKDDKKALAKLIGQIFGHDEEGNEKEIEKHLTRHGTKIVDYIGAELLDADRGIRKLTTGFLGLGKKKRGRTFQEGVYTNVFSVVERSQMEKVLAEQQLGMTGVIDETQAAQAGKLLGVDAVVLGSISISCDDKVFDEKRKDKKKGEYTVVCTERVAVVSSSVRIVNVETGQVMGVKDGRHEKKQKKCEDDYSNPLPPPQETVDECMKEVVPTLVNYFAPRFTYEEIELQDTKEDRYKDRAERIKEAIEDNDLKTAYAQYTTIIKEDPYNDAVLFNMGTLYEAVGDYQKASTQYEMAYKLKSKEEQYQKAVRRAKRRIADLEQLKVLGITPRPGSLEVSELELQVTQIKKVQIRGSSSDRRAIKAAADPRSEVLVSVPGEIELEYLGTEGDWYKVRLLDGREGFISVDDAKIIQ